MATALGYFSMSAPWTTVMRGALGDAPDAAGSETVEDRHVLPDGDLPDRLVQFVEVDVGGAPVAVVQLHPRDLELGPELDQGQDAPLRRRHTLGRPRDGGDPAQVGGRVRPAVRPVEVDQLPGGQIGGQAGLGLIVDGAQPVSVMGARSRCRWFIAPLP